MKNRKRPQQELFHLDGIRKTFNVGSTTVQALKHIDLTLMTGEFTSLMGPSGSGKSTLLNVIGLIERPDGGRVNFLGKDVTRAPESDLTKVRREKIGFIFQTFNLLPVLTAEENVEYVLHSLKRYSRMEVREQARRMLDLVGLYDFRDHKPGQLSGGQRQRVAIARALVKNPAVLLADEPTAALDSKTARMIMELLCELNEDLDTTIVVATHDRDTAAYASRRVELVDGVVVVDTKSQGATEARGRV